LTARNWGVSIERRRIRDLNRFTVDRTAYFVYADTSRPFADLDESLRRRLRQVRWKEWKRCRTRSRQPACGRRSPNEPPADGPARDANRRMPPACPVVW